MKKTYFFKILQLFYGELFNAENSFSKKIMRILSRTPLKTLSFQLFKKIKKNNPKLLTNSKSYFEKDLDEINSLIKLKEDGIYDDIHLKKECIDIILDKIKYHKFQINRSKKKIFIWEKNNFKDVYLLRLFNPHKFISEIDDISRNSNLVNIVRNFLGFEPIVLSSQIWWTFPYFDESGKLSNPPGNEYGYHYDVDDFKFLKLFFYLNDVDKDCGPHIYITNNGSKNFKEYMNRRVDENFIFQNYKDRIKIILGKSGSGFIEDTSFYHKGTNPIVSSGRGVLQIIYGIHRWDG